MHEAGMTDGSRLALVVGFYLSKFDTAGLERLGYATFKAAYSDIGQRLGIKPQSIKNKRDDFDPFYNSGRAGWYQRAMGPSRFKTMQLLDDLSFDALTGLVTDIIRDPAYRQSPEIVDILSTLKRDWHEKRRFVPRGATGRIAEELFKEWFNRGKTPFSGTIKDRREDGCGYDFLIQNGNVQQLIEVKGIADRTGGVLFTDKEWQTARENAGNYNLALFVDLSGTPELRVFNNPSVQFAPRRTVNLTVHVGWQLSATQLEPRKSKP